MFLTIIRTRQGYQMKCGDNSMHYIGYSKRNAERKFRDDFGLRGKHLIRVEI